MQIRNPTTDSPTAAKQNASSPQQLTTFAPSAREAEHKLQLIKFHKGTCWPQRCWGLHDLPTHTIFTLLHTANPQIKKIKFCHYCPCWQGPGGDAQGLLVLSELPCHAVPVPLYLRATLQIQGPPDTYFSNREKSCTDTTEVTGYRCRTPYSRLAPAS